MSAGMWTKKELEALDKIVQGYGCESWQTAPYIIQEDILDMIEAGEITLETAEETAKETATETPEVIRFVKGATYRLYCQNGKIAKRTAMFRGMWNETEGLFKIGATTRPVKIRVSNGVEYTVRPDWFMKNNDMFHKYMNIDAKNDRIS